MPASLYIPVNKFLWMIINSVGLKLNDLSVNAFVIFIDTLSASSCICFSSDFLLFKTL